jgi:hypothetical protein
MFGEQQPKESQNLIGTSIGSSPGGKSQKNSRGLSAIVSPAIISSRTDHNLAIREQNRSAFPRTNEGFRRVIERFIVRVAVNKCVVHYQKTINCHIVHL